MQVVASPVVIACVLVAGAFGTAGSVVAASATDAGGWLVAGVIWWVGLMASALGIASGVVLATPTLVVAAGERVHRDRITAVGVQPAARGHVPRLYLTSGSRAEAELALPGFWARTPAGAARHADNLAGLLGVGVRGPAPQAPVGPRAPRRSAP